MPLIGERAATLEAAQKSGAVTINYGIFLNSSIKLFIAAEAIFLVARQIRRFKRKNVRAAKPPAPELQLLCEIRNLMKSRQSQTTRAYADLQSGAIERPRISMASPHASLKSPLNFSAASDRPSFRPALKAS